MDQINKPVLNSPNGLIPVDHLLTVYYFVPRLLSVISLKTETGLIFISLTHFLGFSPSFCMSLQREKLLEYTSVGSKNLNDCLLKIENTKKEIGDSVLLRLFIYSNEVSMRGCVSGAVYASSSESFFKIF